MTHSSPANETPQGHTEVAGYAASLRQQADLMEKANAGKVSAYVAIDDFDVGELRSAADFIERIRAQQMTEPVAWRILCTTSGATGYLYTECLPFHPGPGVNQRREPEPLYAFTSPGCGEVDPSRPACGQGDEHGRKPTDEGYGHD